MNINEESSAKNNLSKTRGTLAIDLGNTTTVVAFQAERDNAIKLLDLKPISRVPGEIPSLLLKLDNEKFLYGKEAEDLSVKEGTYQERLISNFKPWIGAPNNKIPKGLELSPKKAGELLIKEIWRQIPKDLEVVKLVLSAPVETYKEYRKWLNSVCMELDVGEIALVDEPTAAAIGAGQQGGSKILVIDIGGSTIDMSMVLIEGGEGNPEPIAQLIRFKGQDLESTSKQIIRGATVLGKSGLQLGGRDFDKWILNYLYPDYKQSEMLLNAAERLKCKLSNLINTDTKKLIEECILNSNGERKELKLSRIELENILKEKGLFKSLSNLLERTLARGRSKGYELEDLTSVIIVGGGSRIPIIKEWVLRNTDGNKLLTPPPIEAVVRGAIKLTPGVMIRDILNKGVSMRFWDQKKNSHLWHPLFLTGQPWPTIKPLEILISPSINNQSEIELRFAETINNQLQEIEYINGIPTIKDIDQDPDFIIREWDNSPLIIKLNEPGEVGLDCLQLRFNINTSCQLEISGIDIRSGEIIIEEIIGSIN